MRTTPAEFVDFGPLEDVIVQHLLPAITGLPPPSEATRQLFSLPAKLVGLGVVRPDLIAPLQRVTSLEVSSQLKTAILAQSMAPPRLMLEKSRKRKKGHAALRALWESMALTISAELGPKGKRALEVSCDRGASSWLSCLPIASYGFSLDRRTFQDALAARYGWPIFDIPDTCLCGAAFTVDHAMVCRRGGFPIIRHNHVRDYIASLLAKMCSTVETEAVLQPLVGEHFPAAANTDPQARLDVKGREGSLVHA